MLLPLLRRHGEVANGWSHAGCEIMCRNTSPNRSGMVHAGWLPGESTSLEVVTTVR